MRLAETAPERLRAFYIGGYWRGPNDMVHQVRLGLDNTGATVFGYNTDEHPEAFDFEGPFYDYGGCGPVWLKWEHLKEPIESFDPHLVICGGGGLSFRPEAAAELRRRCCLLGIAMSDPDVFEPTTRHLAANFDYFLTNAPASVPRYQALGARASLLPIGTNENFFYPVPPRPEHRCEVLMAGKAHPDRVEPVRALVESFDTHLYGEGWEEHGLRSRGPIYGEDLLSALNAARITVVFFRTGSGHALVKVALFDFASAGALVMTNRFSEVEPYLSYGKEILGFDDTADLVAKVRHYLDHPEEAEAIRRAGRERVLRDHTWRRIWLDLLPQLGTMEPAPMPPMSGASRIRGWRSLLPRLLGRRVSP